MNLITGRNSHIILSPYELSNVAVHKDGFNQQASGGGRFLRHGEDQFSGATSKDSPAVRIGYKLIPDSEHATGKNLGGRTTGRLNLRGLSGFGGVKDNAQNKRVRPGNYDRTSVGGVRDSGKAHGVLIGRAYGVAVGNVYHRTRKVIGAFVGKTTQTLRL